MKAKCKKREKIIKQKKLENKLLTKKQNLFNHWKEMRKREKVDNKIISKYGKKAINILEEIKS